MKKTIALLLVLVMVLSLAACGGGSTATETPAPTEAAENSPVPTQEAGPLSTPTETVNDQSFGIIETDLYGDWYLENTSEQITINSDGSLVYYQHGFENYGKWEYTDGAVLISGVLDGNWLPVYEGNVVFEADTICVLMNENIIVISSNVSGLLVTMELNYIYENGSLLLQYDGDPVTKQ